MLNLLRGPLALLIRYFLLIGGASLATAGWITQTGPSHFCFDARAVGDGVAAAVVMIGGGGTSIAAGVAWRWWARKRGGLT